MWDITENEEIEKIAVEIYEQGGIIGAVCHGVCGLVNIKLSNGKYLIDGKNVTSFTNLEEEAVGLTSVMPFLLESRLIERGAKFHAGPNWGANIQVDQRVVTGQNPASASPLIEAILKLL